MNKEQIQKEIQQVEKMLEKVDNHRYLDLNDDEALHLEPREFITWEMVRETKEYLDGRLEDLKRLLEIVS